VITFDPDALGARLAELEKAMGEPGFWDDQRRAAAISSEHARLARRLDRYQTLTNDYEEARELYQLDGDLADELDAHLQPLEQELGRLREDALFSGEYDAGDALVTIHAGEGGTDAQDWTEMLVRMYLRWAERRGFKAEPARTPTGR
jgi:peptide chain release factor 2